MTTEEASTEERLDALEQSLQRTLVLMERIIGLLEGKMVARHRPGHLTVVP